MDTEQSFFDDHGSAPGKGVKAPSEVYGTGSATITSMLDITPCRSE
jgi:hypothetical protein